MDGIVNAASMLWRGGENLLVPTTWTSIAGSTTVDGPRRKADLLEIGSTEAERGPSHSATDCGGLAFSLRFSEDSLSHVLAGLVSAAQVPQDRSVERPLIGKPGWYSVGQEKRLSLVVAMRCGCGGLCCWETDHHQAAVFIFAVGRFHM